MGPGPGAVSLLLRRPRPRHPQRHLQRHLPLLPLPSRPLSFLFLHPRSPRPLRLRHLILTPLLHLSRQARSLASYLVLSRGLLSYSSVSFVLFAIVREIFVIHLTKHQSGRTGKSSVLRPLHPMRSDPLGLVLREIVARRLTHSCDGVGAPRMVLELPIRASATSLPFLAVLPLRRSLEVLVLMILFVRAPLLLQITVSRFPAVDRSVKHTVTILISPHDQAARWLDTSCPLVNY